MNTTARGIEIIRMTDAIEAKAFEIFKTLTSKDISFVDCTSFAADQHFKKMGFKLLRPQ